MTLQPKEVKGSTTITELQYSDANTYA